MNFIERKEKLYNRFGFEDNFSETATLKAFRIGIRNHLAKIDSKMKEEDVIRFCSFFGFEVKWQYIALG